jgi:hypothetical protein
MQLGHAARRQEAIRILGLPLADRRAVVLDVEAFAMLLPADRERLVDSLITTTGGDSAANKPP